MDQSNGDTSRAAIGPNTLIRLKLAAQLAFPGGGISVAVLRRERAKNNLATIMIGNREFTTLANIDRMIEAKWHKGRRTPALTGKPAEIACKPYKSSSTVQNKSSSVDVKKVEDELREMLANILRPRADRSK